MKKIFSSLIVLCMMLSMTAFAENTAKLSMTADKSTAAVGETIQYTISISKENDNKLLTAATVVLSYPGDKISISEGAILDPFTGYKTHKFQDNTTSSRFTMQLTADTSGEPASLKALTEDKILCTFKATVKEGATGDITFTVNSAYSTVAATAMGAKERANGIDIQTVTIQSGSTDPVITVDESAKTGANNGVINVVTGTDGNYSVTVKAPIGKTPVLVVGGENIPMPSVGGADYSYAGKVSADATIKVKYDDDTATVITYVVPMSNIYGAGNGIAAFGKGTITGDVEYGIKFGGLTGKYKDITTGEDIKDYKFPAIGNADGIFAVEIADAPAGDYTAQAYVGDTMGAEIPFTK